MKRETIERLLALNARFYEHSADPFSATRQSPWPGWERLLAKMTSPLDTLDLGCGNGRFLLELERRGLVKTYLGVDASAALLRLAPPHPRARFRQADVTSLGFPSEDRFDLVVAFGLLHHLPSRALREDFITTIGARLRDGGTACLTFWRFEDRARFQKKMIAWDPGDDREPGDHLLSFGTEGARYCHHASDEEIERTVSLTGLSEIDRYSADGDSGDLNLYSVLVR